MTVNVNRIKNLAAEYEQAEKMVKKLDAFIKDLDSGEATIYNIILARGNMLANISDGIDPEFLNDTYKGFIVAGMQCEIRKLKDHMDELIEDIKKELFAEPN